MVTLKIILKYYYIYKHTFLIFFNDNRIVEKCGFMYLATIDLKAAFRRKAIV